MRRCSLLALLFLASASFGSPVIQPGDSALRHDIQRLADHGILTGPTTTWPVSWGPILEQLGNVNVAELPPVLAESVARIRKRARWEAASHELRFSGSAAVAAEPRRIQSFDRLPREEAEIGVGISYAGDRLAISVQGQAVSSPVDDEDLRLDGSFVGLVLGNYTFGVNTLDKWWGPGWDGSLILSNNARPIPAFSIDRNFNDPFETKWLSWLGPWDLTVQFGQLEEDRAVPNARFFGMRFNFRPTPSLEIGISRSAQWCGDGRPCDLGTFADLLLGRDNVGDDDIDRQNEPGNQLAGLDARWSLARAGSPIAVYGQFIGEDEAGGFPSRYIGQLGMEGWGMAAEKWSYRWFVEAVSTTCDFAKSNELFDCAYNHGIYTTGYRYRSRSIGHGADNDARMISAGLLLVDSKETQWNVLMRAGTLNRGDLPDPANSLTPTTRDLRSIDIVHSRVFRLGQIEAGIGYERLDDHIAGQAEDEFRAHIQWRSSY